MATFSNTRSALEKDLIIDSIPRLVIMYQNIQNNKIEVIGLPLLSRIKIRGVRHHLKHLLTRKQRNLKKFYFLTYL